MNPKYWLYSKLLSWLVRYFANKRDSDITHSIADFIELTVDKTKPTDFHMIEYIDNKLKREGR